MQRTARLKRQTTVNLYDPAGGAVDQIKALTGLTLTTTLAGLLPTVAQALDAGATWSEVLTAIEAAGQLGAARARYGNLAEASGGSPTAEPSESVAGDVTDRLTDRPEE